MEKELKKKDKIFWKKSKEEKEDNALSPKAMNIVFDCMAVICLIIMAIAIVPKTMQNDTYYNIKCGEYLIKNGIQSEDPFSWHDLSYTWPHWLFDIIVYLVYAICGTHWEVRNLYYDYCTYRYFRCFNVYFKFTFNK